MKLIKDIKKMCSPAIVYLLLSLLSLIVLVISNIGNKSTLCVGDYDCPVDNLLVIFLLKLGYIKILKLLIAV